MVFKHCCFTGCRGGGGLEADYILCPAYESHSQSLSSKCYSQGMYQIVLEKISDPEQPAQGVRSSLITDKFLSKITENMIYRHSACREWGHFQGKKLFDFHFCSYFKGRSTL